MDDVPVDALYLWVGVATASLVALGVAVSLPTDPPPDAQRAAATVESVATSPHDATGQYPLDAGRVRIGPHRIALATPDGTAHATVESGPVTPVAPDGDLAAVLDGTPPDHVFESPAAFRDAAARSRNRTAEWRRVDGPLRARRVTWEEVDVTLVGA